MFSIVHFNSAHTPALIDFFAQAFTESEGQQEGQVIKQLVTNLTHTTPAEDLQGFLALKENAIIGAVLFSRLTLGDMSAFLLSPMAVATNYQKQGIGQQLINHGITQLKQQNTELLFTYGDPAFYTKVGFETIDQARIKPLYPLSMPIGWLGQSFNQNIQKITGKAYCVKAFQNPVLW